MGWLSIWKSVLTKPKETLAAEKTKAEFGTGLKMVTVSSLVYGVLLGLAAFIVASMIGVLAGSAALGATMGATFFVGMIIATVIGSIISTVVYNFVLRTIAKALGGTGAFKNQYYLLAIISAPIMIVAGILNLIPLVGQILVFLLALYALYLQILAVSSLHGFGLGKAFAAIIISAVILVIIAIIVALIVSLVVGASLFALTGMSGLAGLGGSNFVYPTITP